MCALTLPRSLSSMPVHGNTPSQLYFDFRTGRETGIAGAVFTDRDRAACSALNRQRAKGIAEAARQTPSRESLSPHVWAALVAARAREWAVPLVALKGLGLSRDADGIIASEFLQPLKTGAEAAPFADLESRVVYKLFPLVATGGLGKTFDIDKDDDKGGFTMSVRDAVLSETVEKLMVLHDAGAHPTEIVGIEENGDYLIAKQPLALPHIDLAGDRDAAVGMMRAVPCRARFKRPVWIVWECNHAWVLSDLHTGNVMRDACGSPCIIDALLAPLPPAFISADRQLAEAVEDARALREGRAPLKRKAFDEGCDEEL